MIKLSVIKTNPKNPRLIKDDKFKKLCKSLQDFPKMMELRPIIVDDNGVILGGNMRLKALQELGFKEVEDSWIRKASDLTDEEKREFIVKDNVGFGEWDWDMLANEWDEEKLSEWGIDLPMFIGIETGSDGFSLPDGDKEPFQQMTFTLADGQAMEIKEAITSVKQTDDYKYAETMGNENSNGNALYLIVKSWAGQKK